MEQILMFSNKHIKCFRGFTVLEISIVLGCVLLVISLSTGIYYNLKQKAKTSAIEKMLTQNIPSAIENFYNDVGHYPSQVDKLFKESSLTPFEKSRWNGPYLTPEDEPPTGSVYPYPYYRNKGLIYHYSISDGVAGRFGRVANGGKDFHTGVDNNWTLTYIDVLNDEIRGYLKAELKDKIWNDNGTIRYVFKQTY